jgi:dsRNA-specific ribonuclease
MSFSGLGGSQNSDSEIHKDLRQMKCSFKQLADIVESLNGAIAISCGMFTIQQFLQELGILNHPIADYNKSLNDNYRPSLTREEAIKDYNLPSDYNLKKLATLEETLGYKFKNTYLLLNALTHKSYKEFNPENQKNTKIKDYERLEFLGDSILNFLVA